MSAFVLKLLALLSMVVDHTAAVLLYASPLYDPLRAFGRMAFLVYAFFLAEGFRHTRSAPRYALRLAVMGLISTIPYCFTINKYFDFWTRVRSLNIYFTLAWGVVLMLLLRWDVPHLRGWKRLVGLVPLALILPVFLQFGVWELTQLIAVLLLAGGIGLLSGGKLPPWCRQIGDWAWKTAVFLILYQLIHEWTGIEVEYSYTALFLFALLWLCRDKWQSAAVLAAAALWMYPPAWDMGQTIGALLAAVLVLFYNGRRGPDDHRLFYWAYPAHLTVLWAISALTVYTTCV